MLRVSTTGMFQQGLNALMRRQQDLSRTQLEMGSKSKLLQAADDPAAWANAQRLDHAVAKLEQYGRSGDTVEHRLRLQEQAMADSTAALSRASELAVEGNNATLSSEERKLIAGELRSLRSELLSIANRDDGTGRRLFSGTRDGIAPFAESGGQVVYAGDDGRNQVDVAPDLSVADTDPGSAIFMRIRTGDGVVRGSASAGNTGNGILQSTALTDSAAWDAAASPLQVQFTAANAWRVVDAGGAVLASGPYASGNAITVAGARVTLTGAPAAGDSFTVERAPTRDVFATLDSIADALEAPLVTDADRARASNAIGSAIGDITTAQGHFSSVRADTGARLSSLDHAADSREAEDISLQETLSGLRDLDYAEAASRLALQMTALDAAQQVMVKTQSLSLFDKLR
jgi:flagellar hook-associated protein 3 FlgL